MENLGTFLMVYLIIVCKTPAEVLLLSFSIHGSKTRRKNDCSNWLLPPNSPLASSVEPSSTLKVNNVAVWIRGDGIEGLHNIQDQDFLEEILIMRC